METVLINACLLGVKCRYDGSFSGVLVPGNGVLAQRFLDAGYRVYTEAQVPALLSAAEVFPPEARDS